MEKEIYYGVLMNKKLINSGMYLFKPVYLIEGTINTDDENGIYFIDNIGNEYLTVNDSEIIYTDNENAVGYIITKEVLIKNYGNSITDAKNAYFDLICSNVHIGFYLHDEDKIAILPIDLDSMYIKLNNMEKDPNSDIIELPINDLKSPSKDNMELGQNNLDELIDEYNGQEVIAISFDKFKEILDIKDLKEMKKQLEDIYKQVNEMNSYFISEDEDGICLKEKTLTGNYIMNLFNSSYDSLLKIDNINEIKQTIKDIEEVYIDLSLKIDEQGKDGYDVSKANDYLYSLIDKYDEILKLEDLSAIKRRICILRNNEKEKIEALANKYDQISKKEIDKRALKEQELKEIFETEKTKQQIDVKDMKRFFDEVIIGQEEAKKDVISAIVMNKLSDNPLDKNSCLLVGPTGSGKTLIADTVSKYLDMPMEIIDTTQLTMPGYVGANIEDFLVRLLSKTKGDLAKAEEGIVVFDEIDKKGSDKNEDVSGKGVLNTLLPFLQGTTYDLKYNQKIVHFNTSKLTVFATGAFTDVANGKNKNSDSYRNTTIGFNKTLTNDIDEDIKYEKFELEDFVKYGNIPVELMGRFTTIAQLSGHTKESLRSILEKSNLSALLSEKKKLGKINIELRWTNGYLDEVANKAIKLKTGARSLKSTVEYTVKEARWEVLNNLDIYKAIILTEKTVSDNLDCGLVDIYGKYHNLKDIINSKNETSLKVLSK